MNIHGARRAGRRRRKRVGYGLEMGRSVRTACGAGHIVSPHAQLVLLTIDAVVRPAVMAGAWIMGGRGS